jgi:hypothetical protein
VLSIAAACVLAFLSLPFILSEEDLVFTAAVMLKTVTARQLASANSETLRALSAQLPFPAYDDPSLIKLTEGLGFSVDHFKSAFITISTDYYD